MSTTMASSRTTALLLSLNALHAAGLAISASTDLAPADLFSKEFTVDVNTTAGHETGRPLGLRFASDVDNKPVAVDKVQRLGLVYDWNLAHPDDQVLAGDQIIKVNDISWLNSSRNFTDHIIMQFRLARKSKSPLKLVIQRPLVKSAPEAHEIKESEILRSMRLARLFAKGFTVDVNTTAGYESGKPLGLSFVPDEDYKLVTVDKVRRLGLVYDWNLAHKDDQVLAGDQIIKVNGISWQNNSMIFTDHINRQFTLARKSKSPLKLSFVRPSVKHTAEVRKQMHDSAFEAEFTVRLNLTDAHETGKRLGINVNVDTDFDPISISHIKKHDALVDDWNKAHPDQQMKVGDEIVRVNHILWHHNSKTFAERIKAQLKAGLESMPGASRTLELDIQRPRRVEIKRTDFQRAQYHEQLFEKDFTVDLNTTVGHETGRPLGLGFASDEDYKPVTVDKVRKVGLVQDWNQAHPEDQVLVGDQIVKVNDILWHHNSKSFKDRIDKQFMFARRSKSPLKLAIQRPRQMKAERKKFQKKSKQKKFQKTSEQKKLQNEALPKKSPADYVDNVGGSESDSVGGVEEDCADCVGGVQ